MSVRKILRKSDLCSLCTPKSLLDIVFMILMADVPHAPPLDTTKGRKSPPNCFFIRSWYPFLFRFSAAFMLFSTVEFKLVVHIGDKTHTSKKELEWEFKNPVTRTSALALSALLPIIIPDASLDREPKEGSTATDPIPKAFSAYFATMCFMRSCLLMISPDFLQLTEWAMVNVSPQSRAAQCEKNEIGLLLGLARIPS